MIISPKKYNFGPVSLPFLGHVIGTHGNTAQAIHIEAIRNAVMPRTRSDMRSFLGICNWLKEYIPNSSEVLAPLTDMLSPKRAHKVTPVLVQHFEAAKLAFQEPISRSRPDPSLRFVIQTDASAKGMGAVLMQEGPDNNTRRIISFASAKFSPAESRYHCNEQNRPFLEDRPFTLSTVRVDHWLEFSKKIEI